MSAMNFCVASARSRARGSGVVVGDSPARRRWCCVTASGIWMRVSEIFSLFLVSGERRGEAEDRERVVSKQGSKKRTMGA